MSIKNIIKTGLFLTASLVSTSLFSSLSNAQSNVDKLEITNYPTDRVSFYCGKITDKETEETIPATVVWVPQRQESITIIAWKSNYIAAWNAQTRCEAVSPKFQTFYEDGRLNYLTSGVNQGYPIICSVIEKGQPCKAEDQLFQVKPDSNPEEILIGLNELLAGKTTGSPIYQSSGKQVYVSIENLLNDAPPNQ